MPFKLIHSNLLTKTTTIKIKPVVIWPIVLEQSEIEANYTIIIITTTIIIKTIIELIINNKTL